MSKEKPKVLSDTVKVQSGSIKEQPAAYNNENEAFLEHTYIEERYEIINGIRYDLQPSPSLNHQRIVTRLATSLEITCHSTGTIIVAPIDVYLDDDNIFQPDVIYISNENASIMKFNRIEGAPDLVVEILSPSTSTNDKIRKKANYEKFGVKEYWIVDPVHLIVDQFILETNKYLLYNTYGVRDLLISPRFTCINVDLLKLFSNMLQS